MALQALQIEESVTSIERRRLEALIEAVRRFQAWTHHFGCACRHCHALNLAVATALPEGAEHRV